MAPMPSPQVETAEPARAGLEARRAQCAALYPNGYGLGTDAWVAHIDPHAVVAHQHVDPDVEAMQALVDSIQVPVRLKLSRSERLEFREMAAFAMRPPWLGAARRVPKPKAGPWPRDTQYDNAFLRRKGLFHKLVRLPKQRVGAGKIDLQIMENLAVRLARDGVRERGLLLAIFERANVILKSTSSGEQVTMRELRKARTLLVRHRKWPKSLA